MTGYVIAGAAAAAALGAVLWDRRRTVRIMRRLEEMLTAAMEGNFTEQDFDESRLSALESRLRHYLSASALSARSLQTQRDQISALVSDISHQTRTPVSNLRLYAQLLDEQPLTAEGRDCVRALSAQAEKLQVLIEALVKTSRLETGLLVLHPSLGDLEPLVDRALRQYAPAATEKSLALAAADTRGTAVFDPKWTEEAVCNLLDNAVKYTPSGGAVTVEVKNYELFSAIRVSDTGPGISEDEQARIFSRFYRAPGAYQADGVGIGLYLTRQIAESQGGYVKVTSAPGKGSAFTLYLPRA